MPMTGWLTFPRVFFLGVVLLILSWVAIFTARAELAWTAGLIYLGYDTCLLSGMVLLSRAALRDRAKGEKGKETEARPTLTVLVPARNESAILPLCLNALLSQEEPAEEIWVVDDGSADDTVAMLQGRYGMVMAGELGQSSAHPALRLWQKPSTGKARSLNAILPECAGEVIVTVDADTFLAAGSLAAFRDAFARDQKLAAACGILRPRCHGGRMARYFEFFQQFEYLRAFLWRLAWSRLNALVLVSGAFAAYRRDVLQKLGGFDAGSWVEDYELLYRLHRRSGEDGAQWRVQVVEAARAETDAPSAARQFLRQRARWFGGFLGTLFTNRDMVGQPKYGGMGKVLLPVKTIDTLLPVFAATAQLSLIYLIIRGGFLNAFLIGAIVAKLLFDLVMHVTAMRLYGRWLGIPVTGRWMLASLAASTLEPFCFQPLRYTGALLGWVSFARNRFTWDSQRLNTPAREAAEGGQ